MPLYRSGASSGGSSGSASAIASSAPPGGRLTLVSATPVMTSDQTAKGTVYYAEFNGNTVPIYDGANTRSYTFTNLSAVLDSTNHKLENLYDVYAYLSSGAAVLGVGPAWVNTATITVTIATPAVVTWTAHGLPEGAPVIFTNSGGALPTGITAGTTYYVSKSPAANTFNISTTVANAAAGTLVATSGTQSGTHTGTNHTTIRGTGAGTTELELKNGLWVNKNAITLYNNSVSSGSIAADLATYLGTLYCTANGQTGMAFKPTGASGGSNNILGLYNAYNRIRTAAVCRDTAATWTDTTSTWKILNANVNNRISFVDGLQRSSILGTVMVHSTTTANAASAMQGVNINNTTATPTVYTINQTNGSANLLQGTEARDIFFPVLGFGYAQGMQANGGNTGTATFAGSPNEQLVIELEM